MVDGILGPDFLIPSFDEFFIHLFQRRKGPVGESDDIFVTEVVSAVKNILGFILLILLLL